MGESKVVRVFISSPADVRPERLIAERVVGRLAREFACHFTLQALLWERQPLLATAHFQDLIIPPRETDIVVVILWSRLGVQLPATKYLGAISRKPVTGTEYEFEDAFASFNETRTPDLLLYRKSAKPTIELTDRANVEEHLQQNELVEEFMHRWTRDIEGTALTAAYTSFADGAEFEARVEEHLRGLLLKRTTAPGVDPVRWHGGSPYRGLEAFQPEHEPIFFGRTRARNELRELLARRVLAGSAFVLVMGASGSGKSSLVRAGLLPDICRAGMIGRVGLVRATITRPGEAADPVEGLATAIFGERALAELASGDLGLTPVRLALLLRELPSEATELIGRGLQVAGRQAALTAAGEARLLLVVDQLEELFTIESLSAEARKQYVVALEALARSGFVWVVATMRSDFFARIADLPELERLSAGDARYLLALPDEAELAQIVRQPAREAGLHFEVEAKSRRGLDDEILAAVKDATSLPLLEYLLDQLWRSRTDEGVLKFEHYRSLGGLEGAIGARAEDVLKAQSAEVAAALPRVLRALVTVGQGSRGSATARYAEMALFPKDGPERKLIDSLLDKSARLLVSDRDTIRIAHEALLSHWQRARDQIAEDRVELQLRARLEDAAGRWRAASEANRRSLLLVRGLPLSEAEDYLKRRGGELDVDTRAYIEASILAEQARQQRLRDAEQAALRERLMRFRQFAIAVSVLLVLALTAGGYAWHQEGVANDARIEAENSYRLALDQAAGSLQKMIDGYQDGAVTNRMLAALVERSRKTVAGLRGEADDVTAARLQLMNVLSRANVDLGDVVSARKLAGDASKLADGLASKQVANRTDGTRWVLLQAQSHGALSEILRQTGDGPAAVKEAQVALAVLAPLFKASQGSELVQREYMDDTQRLAGALVYADRLDEAAEVLRAWVKHTENLLAREPDNPRWKRYFAFANEDLGDTLQAVGKLAEAAGAYRAAADTANELEAGARAQKEKNKDYLVMVAGTSLRMGDVLMQEHDLDKSRGQYELSRTTAKSLTDGDPSVFTWRQGYAITFQRIGDLYLEENPAFALEQFNQYLKLTLETLEQIPESTGAMFDVANARQKQGDALSLLGQYADALTQYNLGMMLIKELVVRVPAKNARWRRSLANNHLRIGLTLEKQGKVDEAIVHLKRCRETGAKKTDWNPRERWPEDVTDYCVKQIARIGDQPGR